MKKPTFNNIKKKIPEFESLESLKNKFTKQNPDALEVMWAICNKKNLI